jgi:two-component system, LytTR family, sensor kinase
MKKSSIYWICQFSGWFLFLLLSSLFQFFQREQTINFQFLLSLGFSFFTGIIISHTFRNFILKFNWLKYGFLKLIPRFLFAAVVLATLHYSFYFSFVSFFIERFFEFPELATIFADVLNLSLVYLVWSLIYFLFNFIENYKTEEIKNLKLEANRTETELNVLKSQLNPHFMFNAMNSIRALVDEDPPKAKDAITQLSNILRSTLQMGKKQLVSFEDEMTLVKDYLDLEITRYEERLMVQYNIENHVKSFLVPPLMIQTLVENAIKHGISKLIKGGIVKIEARFINDNLIVTIINTGQLKQSDSETGIGIKNIQQRLALIYGNQAKLSLKNLDSQQVIAQIIIPQKNESINYR